MLALLMGMFLPGILLNYGVPSPEEKGNATIIQTEPQSSHAQVQIPMTLRTGDGENSQMDMDDYLVGVILAELPADFAQEAKMAQAVVARTFTLKAAVTGGKHGDGSVCEDSACCQAYISEDMYLARGGREEAVALAKQAVADTSGYVLTFQGELIEATYFSCSGGSTEDALAVWGTDFPYLRATDSPGEEYATHYTDTEYFYAEDFAKALGISSSGSPRSWLGMVTYTSGGGVATMVIGGKEFTGTQLRSLLGLRSTAFTMFVEGDTITVKTRGFGHRVGMSQYGADAMAISGATYGQILAHYYQGTELTLWEN